MNYFADVRLLQHATKILSLIIVNFVKVQGNLILRLNSLIYFATR